MTLLNGRNALLQRCHKRNPTQERARIRVRGPIQPEFCSWRWGATRRAKHPFATRCSYRRIECLITSAAWPWRALHLDNFDTLFAKATGKFLGSTVIRDQAPYSVKGANL